MEIGKRIREARVSSRVPLRNLAKNTGLTISFLSQVERELTQPSLKSLRKIADALNTRVGSLLEEENKEIVFIKKGKDGTSFKGATKFSCQVLVSDMLNISMKPLIFTITVGGKIEKELSSYTGEKFGMVLEGKLALYCDKQRFIMEEGDSIYCAYTKRPDKIVNMGRRAGRILWVILERRRPWVR